MKVKPETRGEFISAAKSKLLEVSEFGSSSLLSGISGLKPKLSGASKKKPTLSQIESKCEALLARALEQFQGYLLGSLIIAYHRRLLCEAFLIYQYSRKLVTLSCYRNPTVPDEISQERFFRQGFFLDAFLPHLLRPRLSLVDESGPHRGLIRALVAKKWISGDIRFSLFSSADTSLIYLMCDWPESLRAKFERELREYLEERARQLDSSGSSQVNASTSLGGPSPPHLTRFLISKYYL